MSRLEELIEELCPNGVECRRLEDCCNILDKKRKPVSKALRVSGEYPYYGANGIQDYVSNYIFDGVFILVGEDGSVVTKMGTPVVNWAVGKMWVNNHAHIIEEIDGVLIRYLFHYIQTINIVDLIHGNIPKLTGKDFKSLPILVPPLEIQEEIVRRLDKFTELTEELTEELTKELTLRKKQYEYYREYLLKIHVNVEKIELNKIANYSNEKISAKLLNKCTYVGVDNLLQNKQGKVDSSYVPNEGKCIKYGKNDILIGNIRPYLRKIWYADNEGGTNGDVLVVRVNNNLVNSKYLFYILSSEDFFKYNTKFSKGAKMPRGNKNMILKYKFYLPSLEEQERIVKILDRFDKLCNDISEVLPAEIEAREKQYEYYREKLLTFKELEK